MSGKLTNRSRTAKTFNLTTKVAPVRHLFARRVVSKEGAVSTGNVRLVLPDSITIRAGHTSESLPDSVQFCPEVENAIKRREVVWIRDETEQLKVAKDPGVHPGEHVLEPESPSPMPVMEERPIEVEEVPEPSTPKARTKSRS